MKSMPYCFNKKQQQQQKIINVGLMFFSLLKRKPFKSDFPQNNQDA